MLSIFTRFSPAAQTAAPSHFHASLFGTGAQTKAVPYATASNSESGATPVVPPECGNPSLWSTPPIINVRMHVTNDEDSGVVAYWALDNYQKTIIVWQRIATIPDFCALVQYSGHWQTFSGARSPQNGVTEPNDGTGPFSGGYVATFPGAFRGSTSSKPTHGFIGNFDYGGTKADILSNTQNPNPNAVDWTKFYFNGGLGVPDSLFTLLTWGWIYLLGDGVGYGNLWANLESGNFGDIVTSRISCPEPGGDATPKQELHEELCEQKATNGEKEDNPAETEDLKTEQSQQNSDLSNEDLSNADFTGFDFSNSNLRNADLSGSILQGVNLAGADLTCASLAGADLSGANLLGAILDGADLTGAILDGVDLTGLITLGGIVCP